MRLQKLMTNYAQYNLWANDQFINWLSTKTDEQLHAEIPSSYSGILKSLHHIWAVEEYWYSVICEKIEFVNLYTEPIPDKHEIFQGLRNRSKILADEVQAFSENQLLKNLEVNNPWFKANFERYEYIQHLFNHSTYHRGQIVTIGRHVGILDGFMTDYNYYNIAMHSSS